MFFKVILTVIIGYLLGCISAAYLIGKKFGHIDIRQYGSGNAGTTNMLRTMGIKYAAPTLLLDMLKAAARLADYGQPLGHRNRRLCRRIGAYLPLLYGF